MPWCTGRLVARSSTPGTSKPVSYTHLDVYKRQAQTVGETDLDWQAILNICTDGLAVRAGRHFDDVSEEREQAAKRCV